jgi:pimeloyl-ACP methyl ester carboxylesterase
MTLHVAADDLAFIVAQIAQGRAHLVGHALGAVVVRATATYRPEVAATVTALPCGGQHLTQYPLSPEVLAAVPKCHDPSLPREEQLAALQTAFFAPGNDPSVWLDGWWPGSGPARTPWTPPTSGAGAATCPS